MTDELIYRLRDQQTKWMTPILGQAADRIEADAEVIKAAGPLVARLKALQTYFDLSDEELDAMTHDERADAKRPHRLITEALNAYFKTREDRP